MGGFTGNSRDGQKSFEMLSLEKQAVFARKVVEAANRSNSFVDVSGGLDAFAEVHHPI